MKKLFTQLLVALFFVGVLASCETGDPLIQEAQKNIFTQNYDSALAYLDRSIEQAPEKGLPYYYKSLTYSEKARTIPQAANRKDSYRNFREAIITAREKFAEQESAPSEAGEINDLVLNTWGFEHNQAIEYVNNDSLKATVDEPLKIAVAHLENAVIINPDSTLSWDILAQVQGIDGNYKGAIDALSTSMEMKDPAPSIDFLRVGTYHRELSQPEEAIDVLEDGVAIYPDSVQLVQVLADVYMQAGQRDKSIQSIENLIKRDPQNAQYRLALGTQLLQATTEMSEEVTANYDKIYDLDREIKNNQGDKKEKQAQIDKLIEENEKLTEEMNELSARGEKELKQVTQLWPEDPKAYNFLGISYQNKAFALYEKRNFTTDNELANTLSEQAKELIIEAKNYYEEAAELDPSNQSYWKSLYQIYVQLDMPEKAQEAQEKAGI